MTTRLTYEYVFNYFKSKNCELLETSYKNSNTKMMYKCKCNNISYIRFDDFRNGQFCKQCGNASLSDKFRFSDEYVKNYINSFNYKLYNVYKNNRTNMVMSCPNGHYFKMTFEKFKIGRRCIICFRENNYGENHPNWKTDRTRIRRLNGLTFNLKNYKILKYDPSYNNYLKDKSNYHIDHIFPRVAFIDNNLDKIYDLKFIREICNSKDNLKIITKEENLSKNGKYNQEDFITWFNSKIKKELNEKV